MRDTATVLTPLFPKGDETMKGSAVSQHAVTRPGPAPRLSDSEVVTLARSQDVIGEPRKDHVVRQSRPCAAVRVRVQLVHEERQLEETAPRASSPVPCVRDTRGNGTSAGVGMADAGVWSSTALTSCGGTVPTVVSLGGLLLGVLLTAASRSDTRPVGARLDSFAPHLQRRLGAGASHAAARERARQPSRSLPLRSPANATQTPKRFPSAQQQLPRLRVICEPVHAPFQEPWHVSTHAAKRTWGLLPRRAANVTAHRAGMMLTSLVGRPAHGRAGLVVSITRTKCMC